MARSMSTSLASTYGIRKSALWVRCRTGSRRSCRRRQVSSCRSVSLTDRGDLSIMSYRLYSRLVLVALAIASLGACNKILDVENPGSVPAESLADPTLVPALAAAAMQTLQCGVIQYAATAGMLSGEYLNANGFVDNHPWEWRGVSEIKGAPGSCNYGRLTTAMGFYTPLQQARFQLDDAFNRLDQFTDAQVSGRASMMAQMRAYGGYADL